MTADYLPRNLNNIIIRLSYRLFNANIKPFIQDNTAN